MICTFYSFKGGVGRSMALANVAELLYRRGLNVLMVDFDLEAPGLERFFEVPDAITKPLEIQEKRGMIDMLISYKELCALPQFNSPEADSLPSSQQNREVPFFAEPITNFITPIYEASNRGRKNTLSIIHAGCHSEGKLAEYAQKVRFFDWNGFYAHFNGGLFFNWFREELEKIADVVLIDSRTGFAEISGICTYQLADFVILFVAANEQSFDGTKMMARSLKHKRLIQEGRKGKPLRLLFVPSRVEQQEAELQQEFIAHFEESFEAFFEPELKFEQGVFLDLVIPYVPYYAFKEKVTVRDFQEKKIQVVSFQLNKAYERLTLTIAQLAAENTQLYNSFSEAIKNLTGNYETHQVLDRENQLDIEETAITSSKQIKKAAKTSSIFNLTEYFNLSNGLESAAKSSPHIINFNFNLIEMPKGVESASKPLTNMSLPKEIYNNANKPIKSITDHLNSALSQAAINVSQKLSLKSGLATTSVPKLGSQLKSTLNQMREVLENYQNLETAVETYQKASKTGLDSTVQESLKSARILMKNAFKHQYWEDVKLVYDDINQAIETLLPLQSRQQDKVIWLNEIQGLAVQAAYALAKNDKLPAAVMTIEQSLARLFSDSVKHYRFEEIQEAAKEQPLVYIMTTELGGLALIVQETITPVWLPELTQNSSKLRYLEAYFQWRQSSIKTPSSQKAFLNRLEDTTHWLWDSVMQPLMAALSPHFKIILIPVGQLRLLPFHAAWTEDNTAITGKRYALDTLTIAYVPNARIWIEARKRLERVASLDSLLAVEAPEPVKATPLPNAEYEIKSIASGFNQSQILAAQAATRDAVLNRLKNAEILHFACHGYFEPSNPLNSGLVMANDEFISLADLLTLPDYKTKLVTLSACETGISDMRLADEAISLSTGFLQAGAVSVVASFWDVFDDTLSMMIMTRFYALWRQEGLEPVEALRQAQLWMRDSSNGEKLAYFQERADEATLKRIRKTIGFSKKDDRKFAHPFYWATFIYVGV